MCMGRTLTVMFASTTTRTAAVCTALLVCAYFGAHLISREKEKVNLLAGLRQAQAQVSHLLAETGTKQDRDAQDVVNNGAGVAMMGVGKRLDALEAAKTAAETKASLSA